MTAATRIWYDAHLSGDDFAEFVAWFHTAFAASLPAVANEYAPTEESLWLDFMASPLNKQRQYKELTIGDLARLVRNL